MVLLDGCPVAMEVDTGASVSIMAEKVFRRLWPKRTLSPSKVRLCNYNKTTISVLGTCKVNVNYQGHTEHLPSVVVEGSGPSLFGRDWLRFIVLDWKSINTVITKRDSLQSLLDKYADIFEAGLGRLKGFKATLHVHPHASPKFCKPRVVPYALRDKVHAEIDRLVQEGTLEPIDVADWAAPIVPVLKSDKSSVRICGDFRMTINPVSKLDNYPLPKVEDLFALLNKGKFFSKLDLSQAYQQLPLDEHSKQYLAINTQKGLFRYTRLPFGVSSAPGIFQQVIEAVLKGIKNVAIYLDDILVTGSSVEDHLATLEEVFVRLQQAGLRVQKNKCEFLKPSVTYLGFMIDEHGLHPVASKVDAIHNAPSPASVQEFKSYLGLLTYYSKFLPNLSSTLAPLYSLLRKNQPWLWGKAQQDAFEYSKSVLTTSSFLTHFDPTLPLILACDASDYGIGAVLSHPHRMPDGTERPIGYASRTLNQAEKNYSQVEKEGLSCIFGIKKFHAYLLGHPFEIITDHKPLLALFRETGNFNCQASARIKRWALFLSSYTLSFRRSTEHGNADALSRLPLPVTIPIDSQPPELILLFQHLNDSPVTAEDTATWTRRDPLLGRVMHYIQQGWPTTLDDPKYQPFIARSTELSVENNCILWGNRVLIPQPGRQAVLDELHELGHPGICKMKSLARMYVWWPGLDKDIEQSVRLCNPCQLVQASPPPVPISPWRWPSRPWVRLHLDFAGPLENQMFLILIDAHSKWIEAFPTTNSTLTTVIRYLRATFARFGLPQTIVTDNGPCFVSDEFENFLQQNGIGHIKSAPYHPASNGLAERAVQIIKRGLKKVTEGDIQTRLAKVLFSYRVTPQATTGVTPTELLLGRRVRTKLDMLKPKCSERVEKKQEKYSYNERAKNRVFENGMKVYVRDFIGKQKWLQGEIVQVLSKSMYCVCLSNGHERSCHADHIRVRIAVDTDADEIERDVDDILLIPVGMTGSATRNPNHPNTSSANTRSYPSRNRRPPDRYAPTLNW